MEHFTENEYNPPDCNPASATQKSSKEPLLRGPQRGTGSSLRTRAQLISCASSILPGWWLTPSRSVNSSNVCTIFILLQRQRTPLENKERKLLPHS